MEHAWSVTVRGRDAVLRGPNITAAQQRRPTIIVTQPDRHG
jgi:hypothetical protein